MARYHIEKEQNIQGQLDKIFYEGENRWTTVFDNAKNHWVKI